MDYPKDFIERVKAEYPDWDELHEALANGGTFAGRYLDDSRLFEMSPAQIIQAFAEGRQDDVLEAAKKADRRAKLYDEWYKIYDTRQS